MQYENVIFTKILHWSDVNDIVYVLITLPLAEYTREVYLEKLEKLEKLVKWQ